MSNYYVDKATRIGTSHEKRGLVNEDRAVIYQSGTRIWMGVFDGVSQGGGGSMASIIASECMETILSAHSDDDIHHIGFSIMKSAQENILRASAEHSEYGKMQTTGVIACIECYDRSLTWFSIGDSAIFVCPNRKKPVKLTTEDTDIGELLAQGKMTKRDASKATVGHELNRWLGMGVEPASIDCYVRTGTIKLRSDDLILVCSDGLYSKITPKTLGRLICKNYNPERLVKAAKDSGSQDDITVIVAKPYTRKRLCRIPPGLLLASAVFLFTCGFLCGALLSRTMKRNEPFPRPTIQESVPATGPVDTLTFKTKENEAV